MNDERNERNYFARKNRNGFLRRTRLPDRDMTGERLTTNDYDYGREAK